MDEITGLQAETIIINVIALYESTRWEIKYVLWEIATINTYRNVETGIIR